MEEAVAKTVLKELREFRAENNKRWEENDKRWEENDRKWKENKKQWEENNRRWKENDKKWKENEKRWEENFKKWEENEKRWIANDERWKFTEKRLLNLEEGRQKDREDLMNVLDTMKKSISNQFADMKEYIDTKFDKIIELQMQNEKEHAEFRRVLAIYEKRLNFQNSRIEVLENWKDEMENGAVFI